MKIPTKTEMAQLIENLRALAPKRPLTYGQSLEVARRQAGYLRLWVGGSAPALSLTWFVQQRYVPVHFVPSYAMKHKSGLTTDEIHNRLQVFINDNQPVLRQRFTLAHELKHILDFDDAPALHANLGCGNEQTRKERVEMIANEFAAYLLMPAALVEHIWLTTLDLSQCARIFRVSEEAMHRRLVNLGFLEGREPTRRRHYRETLVEMPAEAKSIALVA